MLISDCERENVGNLSPMLEPFHLYEFDLKSFEKNSDCRNYEIAHSEYYVGQTFMPRILDPILKSSICEEPTRGFNSVSGFERSTRSFPGQRPTQSQLHPDIFGYWRLWNTQ